MFTVRFLCVLCKLICFSVASQLENLKRAYNVSDIDPRELEFPNGFLQVFGNFDTLTFPRYEGQLNFTQSLTSETDSRGIIYYSNDTFIKLIEGSHDTDVREIVPFGSDSFILSGSGSLLDHELEKQLLYNLSDLTLRPIFDDSLSGVETILVDYPVVYFGGNFTYSQGSSVGHSVAVWNYSSDSIFQVPFGGFGENSLVNSIVKLDSDNILFAGSFAALDNQTWWNSLYGNDSDHDNQTDIDVGTVIPLQWATWDAGSSSFDASKFICPNPEEASWLESSTSGSLECSLPFEVAPQKIRVFNAPDDDSGVSLFRIVTKPSGGIMNLTYVDPISGEQRHCDAFCPLLKRTVLEEANDSGNTTQTVLTSNNLTSIQWSDSFQDFAFVNQIGVSQVQFLALNSYGSAVGLSSFQLYSGTIAVYANNTLNDLGCNSDAVRSSSSLSGGDWENGLSQESYLITKFDYGQDVEPKVTFYPELNYAGQYTVNLYTPGCSADDTCSSRSVVNVTMRSSDDNSILASTLLYQNNQEEKYDQLYMGYLESSPIVTLEFNSSINPNNPSNSVVADRLELIPQEISVSNNHTEDDLQLNGMFLYHLSDSTINDGQNSSSIGNGSLNAFAVQNFPQNSSLVSMMYNNTLLVGGSVSGVAMIELKSDFSISTTDRLSTGGTVQGIASYSDGIVMFGSFNISSQPLSTLTYNGSFNSFGDLNTTVRSFSNISLHEDELLVFNNEFVLNTTSNEYISNSSAFALSIWSAGQNNFNDLLFSGAVSEAQFTGLDGSFKILNNGSLTSSDTGDGIQPYMALRLNDTTTVEARNEDGTSQLTFKNGSSEQFSWPGVISFMRYLNNDTILAIIENGSSSKSQFGLLNLTDFDVIANLTMPEDSYFSSAVFFGRNNSLLVGGNYSISNSQCRDLCLYDYDEGQWSTFANGSISGNITELKLSGTYDLLISGVMSFGHWTSVNLASFNMTSYELQPLLWGSDRPLSSFVEGQSGLVAWNETSILNYHAGTWEDLEFDVDLLPMIDSVIALNSTSELQKREESVSDRGSILVAGRLKSAATGSSTGASLYDFERWSPYYFAGSSDDDSSSGTTFFTDEDLSRIYDSQEYLQNSESATASVPSASATTTPTSTPTATTSKPSKRRKIDRGFVVLIGLALALGTVTVLGITGVLLALVFKFDNGYEQVVPRTDESEMMESVPPEKLLEFL